MTGPGSRITLRIAYRDYISSNEVMKRIKKGQKKSKDEDYEMTILTLTVYINVLADLKFELFNF